MTYWWYRGLMADGTYQDLLFAPLDLKGKEPISFLASFLTPGCRIHYVGQVTMKVNQRKDEKETLPLASVFVGRDIEDEQETNS